MRQQYRNWKYRLAAGFVAVAVICGINIVPLIQKQVEAAPSPTTVVDAKLDINEGWSFNLGDGDFAGATLDVATWKKVDLPHDWSIEQPFTNAVSSEIGHLPGGIGWYRKELVLPETYANKTLVLDFGGAYMDSQIYVNGVKVGNYPNGYMPFYFDVSKSMVADGKTKNTIAVKLTNFTEAGNVNNQSSRWYSGSGIYRKVYLEAKEPVHIAKWGTTITTPNLATDQANPTVKIITELQNAGATATSVVLRHQLLTYKEKNPVNAPTLSEPIALASQGTAQGAVEFKVASPKLWDIDSPNLYYVRTEVLVDGQVVNTKDDRFGFRYFSMDKDTGFSLNGRSLKFQGVCMHHDQGALGAKSYFRAVERQMEIMKDMGVNAIRITHNPASEELLQVLDEKGLLGIEEAFDTWYGGKKRYDYSRFFEQQSTHPEAKSGETWASFDIRHMVRRGRNLPSLIMWSLGNELGETEQAKGIEVTKMLSAAVRSEDTTRLTTLGNDRYRFMLPMSTNFEKVADLLDAVGMNYAEGNYDAYRRAHPNWKIYGSETSSAVKSRGFYANPKSQDGTGNYAGPNQLSSYDNNRVPWGRTATDSYTPDRDRQWMGGQFIWTGFDYIGEPTPWNQSYTAAPKSSYFGIVDTAGFPKDDYYLYQSVWTKKPMAHILPHWNWEDDTLRGRVISGGTIPIRVYSNQPKVQLFVDGVAQGAPKEFFQKTTSYGAKYQQQSDKSDRLYLEWEIPWKYKVGTEIKAVAMDKDNVAQATDRIATAGTQKNLQLVPDKYAIAATGEDLSYVSVSLKDENGNHNPIAMDQVKFELEGDGEIVGVDNGDAASWEPYVKSAEGWQRKLFNGYAVVILRSTKKAGQMTLKASGSGLSSASASVFTIAPNTPSHQMVGQQPIYLVTEPNVMPPLPAQATLILANGSLLKENVTWVKDGVNLALPGEVIIKGKTVSNYDVQATILVKSIAALRPALLVTAVGVPISLPATVKAFSTDGSAKDVAVTWDAVPATVWQKTGKYEIAGTVPSLGGRKAQAIIRVTDQVTEMNIAKNSFIDTPNVQATYTCTGDQLSDINDGIIQQTSGDNRWTNWVRPVRPEDTVSVSWKNSYNVYKVNLFYYEDSGCKLPSNLVLEYTSDGETWKPVPNPQKTVDASNTLTYTYTFDAITAKGMRFVVTGQSGMSVAITELEIYAKVANVSTKPALKNLKLNGRDVAGFAADKLKYNEIIPYTEKTATITAEAVNADSAVTIISPAKLPGQGFVNVMTEDGSEVTYALDLTQAQADLRTVDLKATGDPMVDQELPLVVGLKLEDGMDLDASKATIVYDIAPANSAYVKDGKLALLEPGKVTVIAKVTYNAKTVSSQPLVLAVKPNNIKRIVKDVQSVAVTTMTKQQPTPPTTVDVTFVNALPRKLKVTWQPLPVPSAVANAIGTYELQGKVDGIDELATAKVNALGVVSSSSFTAATVRNTEPSYPINGKITLSNDEVISELPITWQKPNRIAFDVADGTIIKIVGTVMYREQKHDVALFVRITETGFVRSANYFQRRNGYELPYAIANWTNDGDGSKDEVGNLNDGIINFITDNSNPQKNMWTNWTRTGRNNDWIGAVTAFEGVPIERYMNTIRVGFYDEGVGACQVPTSYKVQYFSGDTATIKVLPQTMAGIAGNARGHIAEITGDPLGKDANWTDVAYVGGTAPTPVKGDMTEIKFAPVKTAAMRIVMTSDAGKSVGATEIEAYGQDANLLDTFAVKAITVNSNDVLPSMVDKKTKVLTDKLDRPIIEVTVTNNAKVEIRYPKNFNDKALITVTPENGDISKAEKYEIQFASKDITPFIVGITPLAPIQIKSGATTMARAALTLPTNVETLHYGGSKQNTPVVWDLSKYDENTNGTYILHGTLTLTQPDLNPLNLKAELKVVVGSAVDPTPTPTPTPSVTGTQPGGSTPVVTSPSNPATSPTDGSGVTAPSETIIPSSIDATKTKPAPISQTGEKDNMLPFGFVLALLGIASIALLTIRKRDAK